MTQRKAEYITAADAAAVETLRGYYRRNYPPNNDADFIAWVADVLKHNSAAEWQRVKARMETPADVEPIYVCPTCGARHEDGGRGKPPVYCDECGADWARS